MPGKYRTKTLFIEGVIEDILHKLDIKLKAVLEDYSDCDSEQIGQYMDQDRDNSDGAIELLYDLGFISAEERDKAIERTYEILHGYYKCIPQ